MQTINEQAIKNVSGGISFPGELPPLRDMSLWHFTNPVIRGPYPYHHGVSSNQPAQIGNDMHSRHFN